MSRFLFPLSILLFVCFTYSHMPSVYDPRLLYVLVFRSNPRFGRDRGNYIVHFRVKARKTRLHLLLSADMTSQSGRNQMLATWQEAFTRLNGSQPGITGLMNFTNVRGLPSFVLVSSHNEMLACTRPWRLGVEVCEGLSIPCRYQ